MTDVTAAKPRSWEKWTPDMGTVHCTLQNVHSTFKIVYCTLDILLYIWYTVQCSLFIVHCIINTVYCITNTLHHTVMCKLDTVHFTMFTWQIEHRIPDITLYITIACYDLPNPNPPPKLSSDLFDVLALPLYCVVIIHCTLYTVNNILYSVHCRL